MLLSLFCQPLSRCFLLVQGKQVQKALSLLEEAQAVGVAITASCYDSIIFEMGKVGTYFRGRPLPVA